jgi:hypothetical protein
MAYSTNPFSVATFGESYEQASPTVLLTGVVGTGAIDSGIDVSSRTNVDLTGTQGDGAIGAPTPQAEAVLTSASVSATGTANTVTASGGTGVIITPTSVTATGSTNTVTIVAKAVVVPTGVAGDIITDDPLVIGDELVVDADANVVLASVAGTGAANTVTVLADSRISVAGVSGTIITDSPVVEGDEVVIDADANVVLQGVSATTANNTVTLDCKAVVIPTGIQGTFTVGDETIDAVQFDYEAIKENYSRDRTAYIDATSSLANTVYVRAA